MYTVSPMLLECSFGDGIQTSNMLNALSRLRDVVSGSGHELDTRICCVWMSPRHVQTNFVKILLDGVPLPSCWTRCARRC